MTYEEVLKKTTEYFNGNDLAAKVCVDKYLLRDNDGNLVEFSPEDMHKRIAKELARIEKKKFKNPLSEEEIFTYLDKFEQIIPQGSPLFAIGNPYQYVTCANCYVLSSPTDNYSGIHYTDEELTQISKRRGGVGLDISHLRPAGTPTTNSARFSTGIITFMERYSNSIREVGQNSRRGALLISINVHHPEVLDFAKVKLDKTKVTGANISIRLTDEFLKAVQNDTEYEQKWPVEGAAKISKMVRARDVWKEIIKCAHQMAEPGLLFWDNIIKESPADCYSDVGFETISTNPCQISSATILIRDKGLSTFADLHEGEYIWSTEGWTKVIKKWSNGIKPVYVYKTCKHTTVPTTDINILAEFIGTRDHKVLCNNKKIEVYKTTHIDVFDTTTCNVTTNPELIEKIEYIGEKEVFDITVDNSTHTYWTGGCNVSNCAELPLSKLDSCRLLIVNLFNCVENPFSDKAKFNYNKLNKLAKISQRFMDNIIDLDLETIDTIINKIKSDPEDKKITNRELNIWIEVRKTCENGRRTGTGITAIGDVLAALGLKYDSDQAIKTVEKIYKTLKEGAYESSIEMAEELGPFPVWNYEKEKNNPFLTRLGKDRPDLWDRMKKVGRRNIALLTTAPTGSVSMLAKIGPYYGTTSGIEPLFMDSYIRRKKGNPGDNNFRSDFVDQNGDHWQEFEVFHSGLKLFIDVTGKSKDESPYIGSRAEELDWKQRVQLQAKAQKHIDHSLSSTINLPEDVTVEAVAEIYESAWKLGCKGITVYRKNCRTGVLVDKKENKSELIKTDAPKRPKKLPCEVHHINVKGRKFMVFVGLMNNEPYEIMAYEGEYHGEKKGSITKIKRGQYSVDLNKYIIESITENCSAEEEVITRLVSTSLRHGTDISYIVHQLEKTGGELNSFAKSLARTLKKYIKNGTKVSGEECPTCKDKLHRQEGCVTCMSCGFSKCG